MILNSGDRTPIGAISDRPDSPLLPEFTIVRSEDGSIQFEHKSAEGLTIRERFPLPVATEKSDNFVVMMDVDFRNDGAQPYNNNGYFVYLGAAAPLHTAEYMTPRLIWCVNGHPKNVDVGWFRRRCRISWPQPEACCNRFTRERGGRRMGRGE